jgi:hypothetical protein
MRKEFNKKVSSEKNVQTATCALSYKANNVLPYTVLIIQKIQKKRSTKILTGRTTASGYKNTDFIVCFFHHNCYRLDGGGGSSALIRYRN